MTDADDAGLVESLRNFIQLNRSMGNHMGIAHSHLVNALQALESQRREIEELRRQVGHPMGHDCQLCEQPIYGSMRGFGDGTGQKFVCTECWFRHEAKEAQAALTEALKHLDAALRIAKRNEASAELDAASAWAAKHGGRE